MTSSVAISPDLFGPREETPATRALLEAVDRGDLTEGARLMTEHWEELWWSLPPALTGEIMNSFPADLVGATPDMRLLALLSGSQQRAGGESVPLEEIPEAEWHADARLLRAIGLRLEGRPEDALDLLEGSPEDYAVFGSLREDTSGGRLPARRISVGLIAILSERHGLARQQLGAAARAVHPVRFPWVPRAASALLALTHALEANHPAAALWIRRAEALPRTQSWAEERTDEHLTLTRLQLAVDGLDLAAAQTIIEARPSPFDHSYLWPFAAELHTRYHLLRRQPQAAHALWREIKETVPDPEALQGAARRLLLEVPLGISLVTGAHRDAAEQLATAETGDAMSLSVLADYVAGNLDVALARATTLIPQMNSNPRRLVRLTGIVAGCHHALGNVEAREHALDQLVSRAEVLGLWVALAFSPLPLREHILARELPDHVRQVLQDPNLMTGALPAVTEALTPAEVEAFKLVASGRSRKEISALLHLSENTVKTHLRNIYRKLGVTNRAQARERASEVRALVLRTPPPR